jgi:hypothetical protein
MNPNPPAVTRDPELLARTVPLRPERTRLVLGLDLGTACGAAYAFHRPSDPVDPVRVALHLGQWDLSAGPYDSGAIRFVRLRQFLTALGPDLVVCEDVKYVPPNTPERMNPTAIVARAATALEWFGALKATVAVWCEEHGVPCAAFPIGVIKKRATGKGNANKSDIIRACNATFGSDMDPDDYTNTGYDNVADAAWVCLLGLEQYARGLAAPRTVPVGGAVA